MYRGEGQGIHLLSALSIPKDVAVQMECSLRARLDKNAVSRKQKLKKIIRADQKQR